MLRPEESETTLAATPIIKNARRSLIGLLVILVALAGLLGLGLTRSDATITPKLALDLQGGTQILLAPRTDDGGTVSAEQVQQAVAIIRQRVDASGVSEAEVSTMGGTNILVSIPGRVDEATLARIEASARLDLRPVLMEGNGLTEAVVNELRSETAPELPEEAGQNPAQDAALLPSPQPPEPGSTDWVSQELLAAFEKFDCTAANLATVSAAKPELPVFTCDDLRRTKFILGPVELTGDSISDASAGLIATSSGASTGKWGVNIRFNEEGTRIFGEVSQRLLNKQAPLNMFAFVVDGQVISAPAMNGLILDGRPQISGSFTQESAQTLADQLKYGALPISFTVQSQEDISATLGSSQLAAGLIAGLIGLAIVVIYSIFQYRALGLLTVASLLVAGLLTYLLLTYLSWRQGYRLSLAGVTGIIVAIGITADSFIVYFERVRDALRDGLQLQEAVASGWRKAFRTILASDTINFLAAAILFALAVGNVRGFAFTLGLTTLIDLVVVSLFTHPVLTLLARTRFFGDGHPASGLDPRRHGASYRGRGRFAEKAVAAESAETPEETEKQPRSLADAPGRRVAKRGRGRSRVKNQMTIAERKALAAAAKEEN